MPRDTAGEHTVRGQRILYVTHRFPYPPAGGAKVRAYHSIRRLAEHNTVTVAAPVRDAEEQHAAETLAGLGPKVETALIPRARALFRTALFALTGRTASVGYFCAPVLVRRIRERVEQGAFDLIIVHSSSVAPYVADLTDTPKVLDFVDMDSRKWLDYRAYSSWPMRLVYTLEGHSLARLERAMARSFDLNLTATQFEADSLTGIAGRVSHAVVPNGVDLEYFSPGREPYDRERVCFVGRMDYFPNALAMQRFCAEAWPLIRRAVPAARIQIVGANPPASVRQLASIPGVEVTGTVNDVRPYVRAAVCTVAPLAIARGTQNKLLESMAMGVPVIASPLAARGVDAHAPDELWVAEGAAQLADRVVALMSDPASRARLAKAGRVRVEATHNWSCTLDHFEERISTLISTAETGGGKEEMLC